MALKNRRLFELRLGKLGLSLFIVGMSFLLFFGFLIGVIVGKHMEAYPEQYAFGMMELIRDRLIAASPKAADKDAPDVEEEKFNLTFYETLGKKKGGKAPESRNGDEKSKTPDIPAGQVAPSGGTPRNEAPVASPGDAVSQSTLPVPEGEGGQKRQTQLTKGPAEATGTQNPPVSPATAPQVKSSPPAGKGRFEIQAAAYRERRQAEQMVKKFTALGFSPQVVMKDLREKGRWFRVIVDGFESREKAQEASDRIVANIRGLKCIIRASGSSNDLVESTKNPPP